MLSVAAIAFLTITCIGFLLNTLTQKVVDFVYGHVVVSNLPSNGKIEFALGYLHYNPIVRILDKKYAPHRIEPLGDVYFALAGRNLQGLPGNSSGEERIEALDEIMANYHRSVYYNPNNFERARELTELGVHSKNTPLRGLLEI